MPYQCHTTSIGSQSAVSRKTRDDRLDTRTARLKLVPRREPYWRTIQEGRAIGYRRLAGGRAGTWIARHYDAVQGRQYRALGAADDFMDADGDRTLNFGQAQDRARAWFALIARSGGRLQAPITVADAVEHYLADYRARGGRVARYLETTFNAHILPTLGGRKVSELTTREIHDWHRRLAETPPRLRTSASAPTRNVRMVAPDDADGRRARRATANNILMMLRAALNFAFRQQRVTSDEAWRRIEPFEKVTAPRIRYLTDDEARRLVNACPDDLRVLVTAALLTGCRYAELASLRAGGVDVAAGVLTISADVSKGGRARTVVLTEEAQRFFVDRIAGKIGGELLLLRADGSMWRRSNQVKPLRAACAAAVISPPASFHILRHTHASRLAMRGVPMAVIAEQLGHADLKLTARHYAHLSPGYVADTVRQAFGDLGLVSEPNVIPLRHN
jgi:integrase